MAYPNYIGLGYKSCLNCHYNPAGGGPLTDYGRALSASAITDRFFYNDETSEEDIADHTGFMYSKPKQKWLRPSLNHRSLLLIRNVGLENQESEYIQMLTNANVVVKYGKDDKYVASLTVGYAPTPLAITGDDEQKNYRSREHYVGYRPSQNYGMYAGLLDKPFGIRIPDHIAYSRAINSLTMNDQAHGLMLHYSKKKFESSFNYFIGNLAQESNIRQKGFSFLSEYTVAKDARIGASLLSSSSEFLKISIWSVHTRIGFGKGSSILAEFGENTRTIISGPIEKKVRYMTSQGMIKIRRGLFFLTTLEYLNPNTEMTTKILRIAPGLQFFPFPGLELRFDIYNTKIFTVDSVPEDSWDLAGQVHVWF